jgi:hypothetical protein
MPTTILRGTSVAGLPLVVRSVSSLRRNSLKGKVTLFSSRLQGPSLPFSFLPFHRLYLQPGGVASKGDLAKRFANPTPLGIASFLICLTPFA